jgi:hypothetical protein
MKGREGKLETLMVRLFLAFIATILLPALVHAQAPPSPCPPAEGAGKQIELKAPLDEPTRLGLGYAVMIATANDDPNWPRSRFPADGGCAMGTFKVGDVEWTLKSGGGELAPPRWALPASGDGVAFLAFGPSIRDGYAFSQAAQKPQTMPLTAPMYVLAIERDQMRYVTRVYDEAPPTSELIADMAASLRGNLPPIAALDATSGALSFVIATQSDRRAILPGLAPGQGGTAVHLLAPDGDLFVKAPGGAVRMAGSQFVCPASVATFGLKDLWIVNATDDERDLSCRLTGEKGSISVSVARHANHPSAKSVYESDVEAEKRRDDVIGAAPPPSATGAPHQPRFVTAWTDKDGRRQGLWLAEIGPWYVEALATYPPEASGDIGNAVGEIYEHAFREVSGR